MLNYIRSDIVIGNYLLEMSKRGLRKQRIQDFYNFISQLTVAVPPNYVLECNDEVLKDFCENEFPCLLSIVGNNLVINENVTTDYLYSKFRSGIKNIVKERIESVAFYAIKSI